MPRLLSLDPKVHAALLLGKRRTEGLYKARKAGGRLLLEPTVRFAEGLSDLRFSAGITITAFVLISVLGRLIVWSEELADGSPLDAEYDATMLAVGIGLIMFVLWLLGTTVKHVNGPAHEDPDAFKDYFQSLAQIIPDHHVDKAAILNPTHHPDDCHRFYAYHSAMIQHLLIERKNPRAAAYVMTAVRRQIQHAPMNAAVFHNLFNVDTFFWDEGEGQTPLRTPELRRALADLRDGVSHDGSEEAEPMEPADQLADALHRQTIIKRLILKSMPGRTVADREVRLGGVFEGHDDVAIGIEEDDERQGYAGRGIDAADIAAQPGHSAYIQQMQQILQQPGRGDNPDLIDRINNALHGIGDNGVITNPMPAVVPTFLATVPLPPQYDRHEDLDETAESTEHNNIIDHFNFALHDGEDLQEVPLVQQPAQREAALNPGYHVVGRYEQVPSQSGLIMPSYAALRYPRGYVSEYIVADAGKAMRVFSHQHLQPRFQMMGSWFHWGRQRLGYTQLDQVNYDRARQMAQMIGRLLKYRGPFEAEVAGRNHEQTLFDRALMMTLLLRDMTQLDHWEHWSQVGKFEQAVFGLLSVRQQVELIFVLMSGPPITQLFARALVHDTGERQAEDGTAYRVHAGFSHHALNRLFKAYLAFMQEDVPGESQVQTDWRHKAFSSHLIFLTDGKQGLEQADHRMQAYCQAHTQKPLKMLAALVQQLSPRLQAYIDQILLVDDDGSTYELNEQDLRDLIGVHTEKDDLAILLDDVDIANSAAVSLRLNTVQAWLVAYEENEHHPSLPENFDRLLDAAQRMEARHKRFAVSYVNTYRNALNRAVELLAMLREDQRYPALVHLSEADPMSALPLLGCDTPDAVVRLCEIIPVGTQFALLDALLLRPPVPVVCRHVWRVLMSLLKQNASYANDAYNFLHRHADTMLTAHSFQYVFFVMHQVFSQDDQRYGLIFFIIKAIHQCRGFTTQQSAALLDQFLLVSFPNLDLFFIADQLSVCCGDDINDQKVLADVLDLVISHRHAHCHTSREDQVIGVFGPLLSPLSDMLTRQEDEDETRRHWMYVLMESWLRHDRPRGLNNSLLAHGYVIKLCRFDPVNELTQLGENTQYRFVVRRELVYSALQSLSPQFDSKHSKTVCYLLERFACAYPDTFGEDEFAIARAVQSYQDQLGNQFTVLLKHLITIEPRLLWIYIRKFVVDPATVLVPADFDRDGDPPDHIAIWQQAAEFIYDRLPFDQSVREAPDVNIIEILITNPDRLSESADESADLGFCLAALFRLNQAAGGVKSIVISHLYATYLDRWFSDAWSADLTLPLKPINQRLKMSAARHQSRVIIREIEQELLDLGANRNDDEDDRYIAFYWDDFRRFMQEEHGVDLPELLDACPRARRRSFLTYMQRVIASRLEQEAAMLATTPDATAMNPLFTQSELPDEALRENYREFIDGMNEDRLVRIRGRGVPRQCPAHFRVQFNTFLNRFYPETHWARANQVLREKIWTQFRYSLMSLNWHNKAWIPSETLQSMLADSLNQWRTALEAFENNIRLPGAQAVSLQCVRAISVLFDIYQFDMTATPELPVDGRAPADNSAGAMFGAEESKAALHLLIALLKLPKQQALVVGAQNELETTYAKLIHIFLSSQMIPEHLFKVFYRQVIPRLMFHLRAPDFRHTDDPALLTHIWERLPDRLQNVFAEENEQGEAVMDVQTQSNTLVKKRLSLAYMCWRYDRDKTITLLGRTLNTMWASLSCGRQATYQQQDADWVQGMREAFFEVPNDYGESIGTSEHCRAWIRTHLSLRLERPRLVFDDQHDPDENSPLLDPSDEEGLQHRIN